MLEIIKAYLTEKGYACDSENVVKRTLPPRVIKITKNLAIIPDDDCLRIYYNYTHIHAINLNDPDSLQQLCTFIDKY